MAPVPILDHSRTIEAQSQITTKAPLGSVTDLGYRAFRLFKLYPGVGSDEIRGEISVYGLFSKQKNDTKGKISGLGLFSKQNNASEQGPIPPEYDALSYHWGPTNPDTDPCIHVMVKDENFPLKTGSFPLKVTRNLESALRTLRSEEEFKTFWIDALCIDQANAKEKGSQIHYISKIYNQAQHVRVWLGKKDERTTMALGFIRRCLKTEVLDELERDRTSAYESWNALKSLLTKSWFNRRWIVQEIALAKEATLHCGDEHCNWRDFADVASQLSEKQEELRTHFAKSPEFQHNTAHLGDISELGAIRLVDATQELVHKTPDGRLEEMNLSLEDIVCSLSAFKASEPHDIIYAILSLARDTHDALPAAEITPVKRPHNGDLLDGQPAAKRVFKGTTTIIDTSVGSAEPMVISPTPIDGKHEGATLEGSMSITRIEGAQVGHHPASQRRDSASVRRRTRGSSIKLPPKEKFANAIRKARLFVRQMIAVETITDLVDRRQLRFELDYEKSIFQVCKEVLVHAIKSSKSLDILCRPWAPNDDNDPDFPSWIPTLKRSVAFEPDDTGVYRRVRADPLLGKPELRGPGLQYKATASANLVTSFKFFPKDDPQERSLIVKGFVLDKIRQDRIKRKATSGTVPVDWIKAANWVPSESSSSFPPNAFWRTLVGNRNSHGRRAPSHWHRACHDAFRYGPLDNDLDTSDTVMHDLRPSTRDFVHRMKCVIWNRRLVCLDEQETSLSFCLAPEDVREDDLVCVIYGCNVPVVLREESRQGATGTNRVVYRFIGECYVHGAMDGEATRIREKILDATVERENVWLEFDQKFELI